MQFCGKTLDDFFVDVNKDMNNGTFDEDTDAYLREGTNYNDVKAAFSTMFTRDETNEHLNDEALYAATVSACSYDMQMAMD